MEYLQAVMYTKSIPGGGQIKGLFIENYEGFKSICHLSISICKRK